MTYKEEWKRPYKWKRKKLKHIEQEYVEHFVLIVINQIQEHLANILNIVGIVGRSLVKRSNN